MGAANALLLAMIRECIREGRFVFTPHALTKHPTVEGFTPRQALEAINNGDIIEHRPADERCLIAGTASGLDLSKEYVAAYIHCVCQYDDIRQVLIITMYRPKRDEWASWSRRR